MFARPHRARPQHQARKVELELMSVARRIRASNLAQFTLCAFVKRPACDFSASVEASNASIIAVRCGVTARPPSRHRAANTALRSLA